MRAKCEDCFFPQLWQPCVCLFGRQAAARRSQARTINTDEIIKKFAAKEAEFQEARNNYTYRQTVKMEELDASGNPTGGKWELVDDIIFSPDGKRVDKVVYAPMNTLQRDFNDAGRRAGSCATCSRSC